MPAVEGALIVVSYYALTWLYLRFVFSERKHSKTIILAALVFTQFAFKVLDRFYLASYTSRAGDENFWITALRGYQESGVIPTETLAQGPGIFYVVSLIAKPFHTDYASTLVGLAIVLGCIYVVPTFVMYENFSGDSLQASLAGVILLSMSDAMIYSTTIARPTLLGLFLIPIAIVALQSLRRSFRWQVFLGLLMVSTLILIIHAPITYLVLLLIVSFAWLVYDRIGRWETVYTITIFGLYGLILRMMIPDLDRIWRTEILGAYPLNIFPTVLGSNFFLIFTLAGLIVLELFLLTVRFRRNLVAAGRALGRRKEITTYLPMGALAGLALLVAATAYPKYSAYINTVYGSLGFFALVQSWKIPFAILALMGVRTSLRTKSRNDARENWAIPWLISIAVVVSFLASYFPLRTIVGLWNLDERFLEFAYYPAFYFIAVELESLSRRLSRGVFNWLVLPLISLFVVPSLMVATLFAVLR